jgi:hypothetical protein
MLAMLAAATRGQRAGAGRGGERGGGVLSLSTQKAGGGMRDGGLQHLFRSAARAGAAGRIGGRVLEE